MLQNPCKTLGFKKNMVYKIPPGGGGKPYPASGLRLSGSGFNTTRVVQQMLMHRKACLIPILIIAQYVSYQRYIHARIQKVL